jgi:hypothetical protein
MFYPLVKKHADPDICPRTEPRKNQNDFLTTSNKRDETVLHRGFARELYIPQSGVLLGFK